jgi:hypothetical protein
MARQNKIIYLPNVDNRGDKVDLHVRALLKNAVHLPRALESLPSDQLIEYMPLFVIMGFVDVLTNKWLQNIMSHLHLGMEVALLEQTYTKNLPSV